MATHSNEYGSSNVTILRLRPPQEKLTKSDVDNLLIAKSPRIELVTVRGKSEVWQKFSRIRVDGKEVEFVACNRCRSTLTFKPTSGTNGMRSHRCHGIDDEPPLKLMRMECLPQLPQIPPSIIMPDISASQMRDFLDEAPLFVETKLADELVVFASNSDGEWNTFGCPQRIRHLSTVILDKGIGELLLRDLTEFLNSKSWYEERDRKQLLDYPSDHQLRILFTRFYPESIGLVDKFIQEAHLLKSKRSVAEIQGHFMLFKNDPKKAIEYLSREFDSTNQIQNCFGKLI
ncbi:hypothetical protein B4U79_13468 [Dinothrombium tinctorium]|uniref:Mitochondrial chaperone BCS1-like ATPase lid domain-containing protein n=1 Tax=Dinothrombium tinctorium TaxID=1965070 RepID=A0A443R726_9ACAR|nr:hypothetical protein B4U79_13468 [Dinothrombium tinctorium]